ncbi:hypothetical protein G7B40_032460 [Aetokthonos hydrillicola Thurmond2011]|jgi:hypothetical protein|uniref:Uncharacterized protein n=1 Tax=Aetokthonos hydrillicola Thurmond2011 TaxID=2712845 RepID=A0AAP5MD78_9CYAN|nr:hypothetical protein [Aetokthonos hydrillicola]MBO3462728.1 hypothetical protein [Aetokthonos hydrillicola CCALA 1050]MBW4585734.1 hypothetical protein [Aetokthonos hydrillicola CCALA 1050]MDR9899238.1 hypothetical protein [Aetokthonos hydrillicola Thurmond2011]
MSITKQRNWLRIMHLIASGCLGMFIYSPWRNDPKFVLVMSAFIFPTVALTGLWMWQAPQINKWLKRSSLSRIDEPTTQNLK